MSAKKRQVNHVRLTKSHKVCKRLTLICRRSSKRLWKDNTKPNFLYFPFLNVIMKRWRKLLASTVKLLMVLRARPFAKLLPAHTHTTLNSSLVELKLKKVMCTYRNLGIFTSPFRPWPPCKPFLLATPAIHITLSLDLFIKKTGGEKRPKEMR